MRQYIEALVFLVSKYFIIFCIKYSIRTNIRWAGQENITDHPTLFVASHFTRLETAIIPYVYYMIYGRRITTLADQSLFFGWFGVWLKTVGAFPLQDPNRDSQIIGDLMTGRSCWIIFPEGNMVKNKVLYDRGKFILDCPDRKGDPHTGAAVLALKAEIFKRSYLRAAEENDRVAMQYYEATYRFSSPAEICRKSTVLTPICITYYPMRTDWELPVKILRKLLKKVPSRLEEEAVVEASFLWLKTDMDHYFGKPIYLEEWINYLIPIKRGLQRFFRSDDLDNLILEWQKNKLTQRCMRAIYDHTHVNMDMIFAYAIRCMEGESIHLERLKQNIFLACRMILAEPDIRTHSSIRENLIRLLVDRVYPAFEDILAVSIKEGLLHQDGKLLSLVPETYHKQYHFHRVRVKNKLNVFANELEPVEKATAILKKVCAMKDGEILETLQKMLLQEDTQDYNTEKAKSNLQVPENHSSILLEGSLEKGILLCHDLLQSPAQIAHLAKILHDKGYTVACPRLIGHGTQSQDLAPIVFEEWLYSFERAYALLRLKCQDIAFCGIGGGALLSIISAASKPEQKIKIFAIQPVFHFQDPDLVIWEPLSKLKKLLRLLKLHKEKYDFSSFPAEVSATGYGRVYYSTLKESKRLRNLARKDFKKLNTPIQLVQLSKDLNSGRPDIDWILNSSKAVTPHLQTLPLEIDEIHTEDGSTSISNAMLNFLALNEPIAS